uniref:Oligopeptide transporter n=1 Tax=Tanacetum cinerariifolium TaxID=118510 RepID=A0A6L2KFG2_TANCI|nr:oligopeptide transporter [Tanacetum cinerariifolium]
MKDDVDINTLTIEQYVALIQDNKRPGVVRPEIGNDIGFKINKQLMKELRRNFFKGDNDEDTHKHVRRVLEIADLFHFPGITHDAIMLITLTGPALRWKNMLPGRERINDSSDNTNTKKLNKNIYAFQSKYVGSLEKTIIKYCEESVKKQATKDEWIRKFIKNTNLNLRALDTTTKNLQVKADQLTQTILNNTGERVKEKMKNEPDPHDLPVFNHYVTPTLFLGHLNEQMGNPYKTRETVCMIKTPKKTHKEKTQVNEGDMDDGWDITVKDI